MSRAMNVLAHPVASTLTATLLVAALAACGNGDVDPETESMAVEPGAAMDTTPAGTPAPPPPDVISDDQSRQIHAELREWDVVLSSDTVPAGEITFHAMNTGTVVHALEVEGQGVEEETDQIQPGESATLTVQLEAGTYEVYCPVVGERNHEEAGMRTTLVVRPADSPPTSR